MAASTGFYLNPHTFVSTDGRIWGWNQQSKSGLSGLGDWEQIGEYFKPLIGAIGGAVATRIAGRQGQTTVAPPVYGEAPPQQTIIAGVSNTTLLIGAVAGLLLFMNPPGKK